MEGSLILQLVALCSKKSPNWRRNFCKMLWCTQPVTYDEPFASACNNGRNDGNDDECDE
jgi:hypothetical protein